MIIALNIIVFIWYFSVTTGLAQVGKTIIDLKAEIKQNEQQNQQLSTEINYRLSLSELETQMQDRGLVNSAKYVYLKTPSSLVVSRK